MHRYKGGGGIKLDVIGNKITAVISVDTNADMTLILLCFCFTGNFLFFLR